MGGNLRGLGRPGTTALGALVLVIALATAAVVAASASAASPIDLGEVGFLDQSPGLALGPTGGAALSLSKNAQLVFCQVLPGGSGCTESQTVPEPSTFVSDDGNWPLSVGNEIGVVEARGNGGSFENKYLYFGPPITNHMTTLGTTNGSPGSVLDFTEAVYAPKGAVTSSLPAIVTVDGGPDSSGAPLAASTVIAGSGNGTKFFISNTSGETATSDAAVSMQGTMLSSAYETNDGSHVFWRRYIGAPGEPSAVETNSNWSTPVYLGDSSSGSQLRFATGPSGLYVAFSRASDGAVVIERYNGAGGFEAPVAISPASVGNFAIAEDPEGILHLAYSTPSIDSTLYYSYAKSSANSEFSRPQSLTSGEFRGLRLVVGAGGAGWVSWQDDNFPNLHDWVMAVAPGEPTLPGTPPGSGGSGGGSSGGGTPKPAPPKTVTGPTATTKSTLGHGLVGELSVPKQCLPENAVFYARLRVKRRGTQAHKVSYTVKKVAFSIGGTSLSTDTTKPFEARFLTTGLKRDSALTVAAKVGVALHLAHRNSSVTKSLTAKVRTCR